MTELKRTVTLTVNGKRYSAEAEVRLTLADFIRHTLGLTGTHLGCEHGVCGACTILLDGQSALYCLMRAVQADGHEILTVEGIAPNDKELHPLQEAFRDNHGLQCGFCTPGMLTTLLEFLRDNPNPTEKEVRIAISGNLCRCTGYQGIVNAALDAAKRLQGARAYGLTAATVRAANAGIHVLAAWEENQDVDGRHKAGHDTASTDGVVVFRTVEHLLRPKSIAIIGASDSSRGGWAREIYENLEF